MVPRSTLCKMDYYLFGACIRNELDSRGWGVYESNTVV